MNPVHPKGSKAVRTISQIFSLFSIERGEVGIREASKLLGILPPTLHRLFSAMEAVGILSKTSNNRYRLGERLFELGGLYSLHVPLRKIVRPHAEELAKLFGMNVHVAIPSQLHPHEVMTIDRIYSVQSPPLVQRVGFRIPMHCSGVGKAIFAFLEPEIRMKILKKINLVKFTKNTITDVKKLRSELDQIRKQGFALDRAEMYENVHCVAVPVFQNDGVVASLSLTDSSGRINDRKDRDRIARALMDKSTFISRQL
jgi:DNA-binding IclR family transcriptional regulator